MFRPTRDCAYRKMPQEPVRVERYFLVRIHKTSFDVLLTLWVNMFLYPSPPSSGDKAEPIYPGGTTGTFASGQLFGGPDCNATNAVGIISIRSGVCADLSYVVPGSGKAQCDGKKGNISEFGDSRCTSPQAGQVLQLDGTCQNVGNLVSIFGGGFERRAKIRLVLGSPRQARPGRLTPKPLPIGLGTSHAFFKAQPNILLETDLSSLLSQNVQTSVYLLR